MKKLSGSVCELIQNYILNETMDQDTFDEELDELSAYYNDVHSGIDHYYSGLE